MADAKTNEAVKILKSGLASTLVGLKEENICIEPNSEGGGLLVTITGPIIEEQKAKGIALGLTSAGASGMTYPEISVVSAQGKGMTELNYSGTVDQMLKLEPQQVSSLVGFHCSAEKARVTRR